MVEVTPTGLKALTQLVEAGGDAVLDRHSRVIVRGEHLRFNPDTWLRLVMSGHLAGVRGRLQVTPEGRDLVSSQKPKSSYDPRFASTGGKVEPKSPSE